MTPATETQETPDFTQLVERAQGLLDQITYKPNYEVMLHGGTERPYLQVHCQRPDTLTGEMGEGRGGKAYLSPWMTDSEIVRVAFGLLASYEEHECREAFKFDGRRIFGPHVDIYALHEVARRVDVRPAPAS